MQRHQVLMAFAVAWLTALGLSYWVYRRSAAPEKRAVARIVAAAKPLPLGHKLTAGDLKLITLEQADVPPGSFQKMEDVTDRALVAPVTAGDLILATRLAAKSGGEGLTAVIEPGMRAVAVQVNEVSSVAGFIQPGSRVDVLYTRAFTNGDSATKTLLQNVKVIALGRDISPAPASGTPAAGREARPATVATLMVSQQNAEMLTLAMQRGKIQLALRNPLDSEVSADFEPTQAEDLGIKEPVRATPKPPAPPKTDDLPSARSRVQGSSRRPAADEVVVKVFRGSKVTEETFLTEPDRQPGK